MKIGDICTREVKSCRPDSDLATAAALMRDADRGALPVLDAQGKLVGVITDRDICLAVAERRGSAHKTPVRDVMSGKVVSCTSEDRARDALKVMRDAQIRRLPVVDREGRLEGMVTVNDIIVAAHEIPSKTAKEKLLGDIIMTLMAISQRRSERTVGAPEPRTLSKR